MGIEYDLVNDKDRTKFELGKGYWRDLLPSKEGTNDPDYEKWAEGGIEGMAKRAVEMWRSMHADQAPSTLEYIDALGRRIWAFCDKASWKDLALLSDAGDALINREEQHGTYKQVDSRYE